MGGQWLGVEGLLDVLAGDLINSKEAGACGVLSGEARDVIHERGRAVELRSFGDAEGLVLRGDPAGLRHPG